MSDSRFIMVKSRLMLELSTINKLSDELKKYSLLENNPARKNKLADQFTLRAVGSILHDFYTSVENIFKIVARYIDEYIPDNPEWHSELIQQMSIAISNVRPALISTETYNLLNEFRGFRHVFRNVYGFNLVSERIKRLLDIFIPAIESLKADIEQFIKGMEEALS